MRSKPSSASTCSRCRQANATLLALVLNLSACATASPPVSVPPPKLPAPPAEWMQPPPSETFSARVQRSLSQWHKTLTASPSD